MLDAVGHPVRGPGAHRHRADHATATLAPGEWRLLDPRRGARRCTRPQGDAMTRGDASRVHRRHPSDATLAVPGDKSLSHRALMLAAMAAGASEVRGARARAGTSLATGACLAAARGRVPMTVGSTRRASTGWQASPEPLDPRNSGTSLRLLAGALAGTPDCQRARSAMPVAAARPMRRLVGPLAALGARIEVAPEGPHPSG